MAQITLSDVEERIGAYIEEKIASLLLPLDSGELSTSAAGWQTVNFSKTFPKPPKVVAAQGPRASTPSSQKLTPPEIGTVEIPPVSLPPVTPITWKPLTPPSFTAPVFTAPSLTSLDIPAPSNPETWGDEAEAAVTGACGDILSAVPWPISLITGWFCGMLGKAASYIANAAQITFYAVSGDWSGIAGLIESAVEEKVALDWDNAVGQLQGVLNDIFYGPGGHPATPPYFIRFHYVPGEPAYFPGGIDGALENAYGDINGGLETLTGDVNGLVSTVVDNANTSLTDLRNGAQSELETLRDNANTALADLTSVTQDAVNALFALINVAIGLEEGLSIPVPLVRNISDTGFEIYSPGDMTPLYWVAVLAPGGDSSISAKGRAGVWN